MCIQCAGHHSSDGIGCVLQVRYLEWGRCLLLSLFGWTGAGSLFVPLGPNDLISHEQQRLARASFGQGGSRWARLCVHLRRASHLYYVPAVKYYVMLAESILRMAMLLAFVMVDPRDAFSPLDWCFLTLVLSATLQEMQEIRVQGIHRSRTRRSDPRAFRARCTTDESTAPGVRQASTTTSRSSPTWRTATSSSPR